jgi:hypothetical protein
MLLSLLLLLILLISIKYCYDLHQFNPEAELIELHNCNPITIQEKYKSRSPLLIHNHPKIDITMKSLIQRNPGYIIIDNDKYLSFDSFDKNENPLSVYQNKKLCKDLAISSSLENISDLFLDKLHCNSQYSVSLFKNINRLTLSENKNNILILKPIQNNITIYLINPKHKIDIDGKDESSIKKWSHKIEVNENQILSIPPNWFYFYETNQNDTIIGTIQSDNYFTVVYNHFR